MPPAEVHIPESIGTISIDEQAHIKTTFDRDIMFWQRRGIGQITAAKLVILGDVGDRFTCPSNYPDRPDFVLTPLTLSRFCIAKNTVVISGVDVNAQLKMGIGQTGVDHIVGHEVGHEVQYAKRELTATTLSSGVSGVPFENQATCFAGVVAAAYDSKAQQHQVIRYLSATWMMPDHGSSASQANAFQNGLHQQNCELL